VAQTIIYDPSPNPANGTIPVSVNILTPGAATVDWAVLTTNFRKICEYSTTLTGSGTIHWDLRDRYGDPVANGLYYIRVKVSGSSPLERILKVMVLK
jgi:hypothetical protein